MTKKNNKDQQFSKPTSNNQVEGWWATNPMTYGDVHGGDKYLGDNDSYELGSIKMFEKMDDTFYAWNKPLHTERPFGKIFPYEKYKGKRVLEVGCGLGTMSMNWAKAGADVTAIDLNQTSIDQTTLRFKAMELSGDIQQMDANALEFDDDSFDYVYSWGVIHHSPNLKKSLHEIIRVLKPGGEFGIMLYYRPSFLHQYMTKYIEGFLHYENRFLGELELASRYGDGAREEGNPHTWPITKGEMRAMLEEHTSKISFNMLGTDIDNIFPLLIPGIGDFIPAFLKKPWARRFGWSLWTSGQKELG